MNQVSEILGDKGREVLRIEADASVLDAVRQMVEANVGSLLVVENDQVLGIISERDYARKLVLHGRSSVGTPVRDIMTSNVVSVRLADTADHCMQLVTNRRIRHLPVVEGDAVLGVVSIGDLVKAVIEDQQVEIEQLQRYIAS